MGKKIRIRIQIRDEQPDHISESLETFFWVKILKFFDADPGWKNLDPGWKSQIQDPGKHPGAATLIGTCGLFT